MEEDQGEIVYVPVAVIKNRIRQVRHAIRNNAQSVEQEW